MTNDEHAVRAGAHLANPGEPGLDEVPVYFESPEGVLAGILTTPPHPTDVAVLLCWGTGAYPFSGRNRIMTRFAREFAGRGFAVLRFGYAGIAESDGELTAVDFARPYSSQIVAAWDFLRSQGFTGCHLVANCLGGWSAIRGSSRIDGLRGVIANGPPVRGGHVDARMREMGLRWWTRHLRRVRLRNLRDAGRRAHYRRSVQAQVRVLADGRRADVPILGPLCDLADRSVPVVLVVGQDSQFRADVDACRDALEDVLAAGPPPSGLVLPEHSDQSLASLEVQQTFLDQAVEFVTTVESRLADLDRPVRDDRAGQTFA